MSSSDDEKKKVKKLKKKAKKSRKRKHSSRSSSTSSTSSSSSSSEHKHKKRRNSKKSKKRKHRKQKLSPGPPINLDTVDSPLPLPELPKHAAASSSPQVKADEAEEFTVKPKGPMTKEQWEKQQSTLRRVFDPQTQRTRLIRGDGEIVEEIVSRDRHVAINKAATRGDGAYYETVLGLKKHI